MEDVLDKLLEMLNAGGATLIGAVAICVISKDGVGSGRTVVEEDFDKTVLADALETMGAGLRNPDERGN